MRRLTVFLAMTFCHFVCANAVHAQPERSEKSAASEEETRKWKETDRRMDLSSQWRIRNQENHPKSGSV